MRYSSQVKPISYLKANAAEVLVQLANANHVLEQLMDVVESLAGFPERGSFPKELVALGIKEYRQASFKPYRVIYRVLGEQVIVYLIADGRRDMQSVLARRLLGA